MDPQDVQYKISCCLVAHELDVRAIVPTHKPEGGILSGSRDMTARIWIPNEHNSEYTEGHILRGHSNFISSVCCMPPDEKYPHGLLLTGSNDNSILGFTLDSLNPEFKLEGHSDTVCALAAGKFGSLVSGSWDKTAKVWLNQKCVMTLAGHDAAVWAVAIMPEGGFMITGSADKTLKLWRAGKCQHTFKGHTDCVRGTAVLSATEFISCSNDASIRKWNISGECTHTFYGHTNFVYSVAVFSDGSFASSSEDRTLRVWSGDQCIQTITHPAQSVWDVCALPNGDIATGASDGVVRVFSKSSNRHGSPDLQKQFEDQLASSTIPSQIGDLKTEDLVGPESLLNPGKSDGQTLMVRDENGVTAHQWVAADKRWQKVGDVVGGSGGSQATSGKQLYEGKEYDYVFDVDIQEDKPPIKLPYNANEDPWMAAHNWLENNDISQMYLDQVAKFIMEQTKGITIGSAMETQTSSDPFTGGGRYIPSHEANATGGGGSDPFTGGGRYQPGASSVEASTPPTPSITESTAGIFALTAFLSFEQANVQQIVGKLRELNTNLQPNIKVSEEDIVRIETSLKEGCDSTGIISILLQLMQWSSDILLPVLDILRLVVKEKSGNQCLCEGRIGEQLLQLILSELQAGSRQPNVLLSLRTLCNAFKETWGQGLLLRNRDDVIVAIMNCREIPNKNIQIALSTVLLNYAIAYRLSDDFEDRVACLSAASMIGPSISDSEARYRLIICIGSLVYSCDKTKQLALSLDIKDFLKSCMSVTTSEKLAQSASALHQILS